MFSSIPLLQPEQSQIWQRAALPEIHSALIHCVASLHIEVDGFPLSSNSSFLGGCGVLGCQFSSHDGAFDLYFLLSRKNKMDLKTENSSSSPSRSRLGTAVVLQQSPAELCTAL